MLTRALPLFAIIGLGALAGRVGLFPDLGRAIAVLNRFALYVAFPLLVVGSLANPAVDLTGSWGFYALHGLGMAAQLAFLAGLGRALRLPDADRSALSLAGFFGNIAYLGIPFCISVLGPAAGGLAALSAAVHLAFAMTLGPALLAHAAEHRRVGRGLLREVARQPLVWSPLVGLVLRLAPGPAVDAALALASPVGAAAGPVALFMLGLYLTLHRDAITLPSRSQAALALGKLAVYPALVWLIAWAGGRWLALTPLELAVATLMAGMPVAITTFALAEEYGAGRDVTARGIVLTTLCALLTLPVLASVL